LRPALAILAAGESRRLGECKALVELGGRTVLERLLAAGACCDGAVPLIVTGAHHDEIAARVHARCELAHNASWRDGRTGSALTAARARPELDLVLAPVDVPLVPAQVFDALVERWLAIGSPARGWLAPRLGPSGPFGHPVVIGRELARELELLAPGAPLRELRARAATLEWVETDSPAILDDLDGPDDLERLRERLGGSSGGVAAP
jgi:CTP:molybdopterin cytidylyltransferase MocA